MNSLLAKDAKISLHSEQDVLDIFSAGLPACIFTPDDLHPEFFNLENRIAGNIFQKFVNYFYRAAFVVPENHEYGDRVTELIREHKDHPYIRFFTTIEDASAWLA